MIFLSILICCNIALFQIHEEFIYKTKFKGIRAGKTKISLLDNNSEVASQRLITIESYSTRLIDLIYKLRHFSTIIINPLDYSLLATTQKIQQGKYINSYNATVDQENSIIYYQNTHTLNTDYKQTISIPFSGKLYDPFAIVFYLRNLDLNINNLYNFTTYSKKKIRNFNIQIIATELVKTPLGTKECYLLIPESLDGKNVLKNKGEMKIWLTTDSLHLPLKIQQKMKHGTMELILENYVTK